MKQNINTYKVTNTRANHEREITYFFQGRVNVSSADLVSAFGQPDPSLSDEYKTDYAWVIEFNDGIIATIYNYKNGKNYLGDEGESFNEMSEWQVQGNWRTNKPHFQNRRHSGNVALERVAEILDLDLTNERQVEYPARQRSK